MTRITPRTCLWPLAGSLVFTFCLSFGLTFRSNHHCFAGTCGEWLFPLQARLHVVVFYCWLAISVTVLAIRAFHPSMRRVLRAPLFNRKIPVLGKHLGVGGILVVFWVLILYGIAIGIWWVRLKDYFKQRGADGGVLLGNGRLAAIALTGHLCDLTMGLAIIPISRHSALASFFKISVATTLTFHMLTAYALFTLVGTHGFLYVSWIPVYEGLSQRLRMVYPVLNPTYLYEETWPGNTSSLGVWRASLIFTGIVTSFIMLLMFITTLPSIRNRHFNLFYFTHLLGIVAIVIICLHASTMFYCTAPGLLMWLLDWLMRLYELRASLHGNIEHLGKGWYCLSVPLPRRRLVGCACTSPLAHFFIYHSESSVRELHPFTTTTHLASQDLITPQREDDLKIQFLFRQRGATTRISQAPAKQRLGFANFFFSMTSKLKSQNQNSGLQWTDKLAGLTHQAKSRPDSTVTLAEPAKTEAVPVSLRLEGPYFTTADPSKYKTVLCVVAGTGVSGALAISGAFQELERQCPMRTDSRGRRRCTLDNAFDASDGSVHESATGCSDRRWTRCVVIWSVREDAYIDLPGLQSSPGMGHETQIHLTGNGRKRLSVGDALDKIIQEDTTDTPDPASIWVYLSGPNAFIEAGETACKERHSSGVDWYGARWDI